MLIKTRGIIFRAVKYSETSIITDVYTEEKGLRTYIISGVRTKKSKVSAGLLQVMSLVDLIVYHRDDKDMQRIKEIKPAHVFQSIPFDVRKGAIGMFMVELARKAIREQEENQSLFHFLFQTFQHLDTTKEAIGNLHLCFMIGLSGYLGFLPEGEATPSKPFFDLREGVFTPESPHHSYVLKEEMALLFSQFLKTTPESCHHISINRSLRNELLQQLITFYRLHIENLQTINSHLILKEIF